MFLPYLNKPWLISLLFLASCTSETSDKIYQKEFERIAQLQTPVTQMRLAVNSKPITTRPARLIRPKAKTVAQCWEIAAKALKENAHGEADCITSNLTYTLTWVNKNPTIHADGWIIPRQGAARKLVQ